MYSVELNISDIFNVEAEDMEEAFIKAAEEASMCYDVEDFQITTIGAKEIK